MKAFQIIVTLFFLVLTSTTTFAGFNTGASSSGSGNGFKTDAWEVRQRLDRNNANSDPTFDRKDSASKKVQSSQITDKKLTKTTQKTTTKSVQKIQKVVSKSGAVSYSDASSQQLVQNDQIQQVEVIQVATAPSSSNSGGFSGGTSQEHQSQWANQFTMFPQDQNGWSIIHPQKNSRIIYVSSSEGNDIGARSYTTAEISDPKHPTKKIAAFKTITAAVKLIRDGYPDWILLKKGDEWQLGKTIFLPSGESSLAPLVISAYGESTERPLVKTGTKTAIKLTGSRSYIAVMGINFYANQRDPDSPDFIGWNNVTSASGLASISGETKEVQSIYLEDNIFNFFSGSLGFQGNSRSKNIIVRRNQLINSYSNTSHSGGIFAKNCDMLLEGNLLDHNGWYQQNFAKLNDQAKGQATFFNHHAYLSKKENTIITGNIFTRASSISIKLRSDGDKNTKLNRINSKNILIKDNLFAEGEIGISAGGNIDYANGFRFGNMSIIDNVMLNIGESQPTRRNLAWYIDVNDWDTGVVKNNYLLYNDNPSVKNVYGIQISGLNRNVTVMSNVVHGIGAKTDRMIYEVKNEALQNVNISQNNVDSKMADKGARLDLASYFNISGDGVDALVKKAKTQSKAHWNKSYTAHEINNYLKGN